MRDPFPGRQLALGAVALDRLLSATLVNYGLPFAQLLEKSSHRFLIAKKRGRLLLLCADLPHRGQDLTRCLAIIIFCTSEVPSPMVMSFTSR